MGRRIAFVCFAIVLVIGTVWFVWFRPASSDAPSLTSDKRNQLLQRARTWLKDGRLDQAESAADEILAANQFDPQGLLVAGEIAVRRGDLARAAELFGAVPDDAGKVYADSQLTLGETLRLLGRLTDAERAYRRVLEQNPASVTGLRGLSFVLNISGRRWEALPVMLRRLDGGTPSVEQLTEIGNLEQLVYNADFIAQCLQASPDDPLPKLGQARVLFSERKFDAARKLLVDVRSTHPDLVEAQIRFGELLHEVGDEPEFLRWQSSLPEAAKLHPDLWALLGSWARVRGQNDAAARCYGEAVRLDPDHRVAVYQLSQLCLTLGRASDGAELGQRAARLQELTDRIDELRLAPGDTPRMASAARLCMELGRFREALGWAAAAAAIGVDDEWVAETQEHVRARPLSQAFTRRSSTDMEALARLKLDQLPMPDWDAVPDAAATLAADGAQASPIRFVDVANEVGLDFQYFNSADPESDGMRMFEFTGGGVAALDYDRDGWTDLYFTQGCEWPPQAGQRTHIDALFRNREGTAHRIPVENAGLVEERYSQGVGVGDFNSDGFPDLYVANIGRNTLWINNGDGSYAESDTVQEAAEEWTTSCLLADLDGDSLADLYDVNYLEGEAIYTRICQEAGRSRACMPTVFDPAHDAAWRNNGDNSLTDGAAAWKLELSRRNGLGIVAADFDAADGLDLFVANDAVANAYYPNIARAVRAGQPVTDEAVLAGLAFDRDGKAQACMGVACGDADLDGRADLFVTNYFNESNTLYRQEADALFVDETAAFGLRAPSYQLLGFGAQFLDADLDGQEDLVLVNGHVDDFTHEGTPYRMRPQFLRNRSGRFSELFGATTGEWFDREQLGRGLCRLDWNRDGLPDFAVTHLDTPASLVLNRTDDSQVGNSLRLSLVGVAASRDAIGAIVTVRVGDLSLVRHLSAGDGYQASNERQLVIGLGAADRIDHLEVHWPDGSRETFEVPAGEMSLLITQSGQALSLPH
ncbi:MAG: VCBS repeat-containing protein [Planctomycetaceae bacterium]|nr:VCBS repeat-containing protein [Planctomycetaceae bacterium]